MSTRASPVCPRQKLPKTHTHTHTFVCSAACTYMRIHKCSQVPAAPLCVISCTHTYKHMHELTDTHTCCSTGCISMHTHTQTHTHTCCSAACIFMHTHAHTHLLLCCMYFHARTCTQTHTHTHTHTCCSAACIFMHTHAHTHTLAAASIRSHTQHTDIHTHTHTPAAPLRCTVSTGTKPVRDNGCPRPPRPPSPPSSGGACGLV